MSFLEPADADAHGRGMRTGCLGCQLLENPSQVKVGQYHKEIRQNRGMDRLFIPTNNGGKAVRESCCQININN